MKERTSQLRRPRRILQRASILYKKRWKRLSPSDLQKVEALLSSLQAAIDSEDVTRAADLAREVGPLFNGPLKRPLIMQVKEIALALLFALVLATVVRSMWFEPMRIPSGSMRPSFQELDHLVASKTAFGINIPLLPAHFAFDPSLINRTDVFIFTSEGMDISDQDTRNFLIFPSKRRLIKRCMGKPGDTLYFYGGKIYGIDSEGADLAVLRESPWIQEVEAVPFISFEGKISLGPKTPGSPLQPLLFHQMNQPVGKMRLDARGAAHGELLISTGEWIPEKPAKASKEHLHTYAQLYGMDNYAKARLLTRQEVVKFSSALSENLPDVPLYLELRHHPLLTYPRPQEVQRAYGPRPYLNPEVSLIPLSKQHLERLLSHLFTSRFVVKGGYVTPERSDSPNSQDLSHKPCFKDVPDGRYEFEKGTLYLVGHAGIRKIAPQDHPLNSHSIENIQRLFNLGVEFSTLLAPSASNQTYYPSRFVYFRDGDLCLFGHPLLTSDDPTLVAFNDIEEARARSASSHRPYLPFKDLGPPLKEGRPDLDRLRTFGLRIPDKMYLGLGDNYSSSGDSRYFGFIPESNIQGTPLLILWPLGKRFGLPPHSAPSLMTWPTLTLWGLAALILAMLGALKLRERRKVLFVKLSAGDDDLKSVKRPQSRAHLQ